MASVRFSIRLNSQILIVLLAETIDAFPVELNPADFTLSVESLGTAILWLFDIRQS